MVSQCAYCYSSNRKSAHPFSTLLFTSLNGRTKARLDMLGTYQNWKGVEWWEEGYDALWKPSQAPTAQKGTELRGDALAEEEFVCPVTGTTRPRTKSSKEGVVYLTADSDVELLELSPEETYVIGGIVDKNRYKVVLFFFFFSFLSTEGVYVALSSPTRHFARTRPVPSPSAQRGCRLGSS